MRARSAFTFLEMMVVLVVIGVLAAIVIPRFGAVSSQAETAATQSTVGGVRAGIAAYRSRAVISGADPFPTGDELAKLGVVVQQVIPANPFTRISGVQVVDADVAAKRGVLNTGTYGWNYWYDNKADPPAAVFYANCENTTTASDGAGGFLTGNQL